MKLENLVTSLRLSKRLSKQLKAKGIEIKTNFHWRKYSLAKKPSLFFLPPDADFEISHLSGKLEYDVPAWLSGELGERLPEMLLTPSAFDDEPDILVKLHIKKLVSDKKGGWWEVGYIQESEILGDLPVSKVFTPYEKVGTSLPECLGLMLEHLLKNNLIKGKGVHEFCPMFFKE